MENKKFIGLENVSMWYPAKNHRSHDGRKSYIKAVDGVSLEIGKGEILGIIGESGCGKSTLGRILTRLEEPTSGDVVIDGIKTSELIKKDSQKFRRLVQIIFQNPFDTFTPRDTIGEILKRPLRLHGIVSKEKDMNEKVIAALENSGLNPAKEIMERYPHELSGGQLQRISIIRSMLLSPEFLVADEPVSMLDVSVRAEIINMLLKLNREKKTTIAFISHDIGLTRYISDFVAVMYLGKIIEYGKAEEVMENPGHPYTKALISWSGSADPREKKKLIPISGEPPTPINPGPGCYFAPRCYKVQEECFKKYPEKIWYSKTHFAMCDK